MVCTKIKASSRKLRVHDSYSYDVEKILSNHKKNEKDLVNESLESNYQRGFQQGIAAILDVMDENNTDKISRVQLKNLINAAGAIRYEGDLSEKYSYEHFTPVFLEKSKRVISST